MNLTTLAEFVELFEKSIIKSGFKRDLQDYIQSLPDNQNNILALRDLAEKVSIKLDEIYGSDLPESLGKLFPNKIKPFTDQSHDDDLIELKNNKEIKLEDFFVKLNQILSQLNEQIQQNITEITTIKTFIEPFLAVQDKTLAEDYKAIISIIFKDKKTTTLLTEFTKNIQTWNRIIPVYHQLLKSSSPEDIEIVTVQNGSIDFVINIDFDIALNLVELFKVGFKCFMAYLSYKSMVKPLVASYFGNKKLIAGEKEREKELINNIGLAVKDQIKEQHKSAIKKDKEIDKNIDKKVEQVVKLVTLHILKGNDLKLLSLPEETNDDKDDSKDSKEELRTISTEVRQALKAIPVKEMKALLEKYSEPDEE